ncbi:MAG TPA: tetratricopeptide repeat protein [Polyangiaceae bacterium]
MRFRLLVSTLLLAFSTSALSWADPQISVGGSVSTGASAQAPAAPAPAPKAEVRGKTPYGAKVVKGHGAYAARDFAGAVAAYKEAIAESPTDPSGYYFLGEAQLAAGNIAEADASFATGLARVGAKDDMHAKLLFVIADLRERQGKWPEAKKAWEQYSQFVSTHPNANGYIATATERIKMVDVHVDLETKYGEVKKRIEQRLKETTSPPPPPDDGPQGPTKKK